MSENISDKIVTNVFILADKNSNIYKTLLWKHQTIKLKYKKIHIKTQHTALRKKSIYKSRSSLETPS